MINKRILSTLLALAILLSCVAWTPVQAQGTAPEEETIDNVTQTLDNEDSPEYVDAEQFEEAGHVQRLYDEEELDTYVYLNEDGSKSVYYMDQDVKFIDEQGNVQEKDTALVRKERGYGMRSNDVGLHIPDSAADGITVSHKSREVKLLPVGGTGLAAANDNSILYSNFFGRGIHLQYTPILSGVKEDVIITKYTGVNSFSFLLETGGLYLLDADGRYYLAESATAKAAFYLGEVLVYDAIGRPDMGTMVVETITPGQRYKLTISANEAFLTDPETLYPVTVDPTLTVSDNTHGAGAIEDAPVFSGKPNKNFGSYVYNTIGYHSADYGTAMTVVRLTGLLSDDIYESLSESNIENVTFYMKDGGSSSAAVNIHAVTGSDTWTESNVTNSNLGAYSMAIYATDTMGGGSWGEFNITYLVRLWKNGTLNPQRGFVMAISDSTKKIGALSSEYSNTDYRPYVVVTYTLPPGIEIAVDEGDVIQLNTNMTGAITWTSSDESLATVSSYGLVEGIRAGKVTITASCSNHESSTYTVYVTVPDGVYYVKNLNSNYYLHVNAGGINNLTDVIQYSKYSDTTTATYRIRQMWKTCYLGNGRYSIRPMNKLDKGLDVTSGNVDIYNIGTSDSLSNVQSYGEWTIEWYTTGYVFKNNGDNSKTMQVQDASKDVSATIIASTYSTSVNCRWDLERIISPPSGVYWYNTKSNTIEGTSSSTKYIDEGSTATAADLGLVPILYSASSINQTFNWTINSTSIASVNSSSGQISALQFGDVVVTATSSYGSYILQLHLRIKSLDPFHCSNIQYMNSVRITGTNWWGLGGETDHAINIFKSTLLADDYCVIHDNIYAGYYRVLYINDELKTTLNNLEAGYQEHYNIIPLLNTTTTEENTAHLAKGKTDQLVDAGYFAAGSSEYYGVWAYNYVSSLNLLDYWKGVIDTATAAFQVYLALTTFYYSYMSTLNTNNIQVSSTQYQNASSVLDDIDDAMYGMNYTDRTTVSADSRNTALAQQGYTSPLPYKPQTPVVQYQQTSSTQYVRVFTTGSNGNKIGRWLMKYSDIQGLTPAQIQSKFALPTTPTHYCFVNVPAGTIIYVGAVNGSSVSGTLQYELAAKLSESYYGISMLLP